MTLHMKTLLQTLFAILFVTHSLYAQEKATTQSGKEVVLYADGTWAYVTNAINTSWIKYRYLEQPGVSPYEQVIERPGYILSYNETHEQASWVAYVLTREEAKGGVERDDLFEKDPDITTGTADDMDYKGSGYDRGHLAPAADMGWSATSMQESFYYSNMSPQLPGFNRGVWKRLEELLRFWAVTYDSIYVVTGPVLTTGLPTIGPNQVSVPQYYYKAVLRHTTTGMEGIGFVLPHASSTAGLQSFAVPIDSVERLAHLSLFPGLAALSDSLERHIESTVHVDAWQWVRNTDTPSISPHGVGETRSSSTSGVHSSDKPATPVRCAATTQKGDRCRNKTTSTNGRCWRHGGKEN